jgi:hypothetical protein
MGKNQGARGQGRKPYGFYEGEQQIIARMQALKTSGLGFDRIAEQLNEEGLRPRTGERWWGKTVNNILRNANGRARCGPTAIREQLWQAVLEAAMDNDPPGWAPVSVRELRAALPAISHDDFDRAALQLRNERRVFLSRHDFAQAQSEQVRWNMIREGNDYYLAISIRWPEDPADGFDEQAWLKAQQSKQAAAVFSSPLRHFAQNAPKGGAGLRSGRGH